MFFKKSLLALAILGVCTSVNAGNSEKEAPLTDRSNDLCKRINSLSVKKDSGLQFNEMRADVIKTLNSSLPKGKTFSSEISDASMPTNSEVCSRIREFISFEPTEKSARSALEKIEKRVDTFSKKYCN